MKLTRDAAIVNPGDTLYYVEPGTTEIVEIKDWTDPSLYYSDKRWAIEDEHDKRAQLYKIALEDAKAAQARMEKHVTFMHKLQDILRD
jgi:hypothetical protein